MAKKKLVANKKPVTKSVHKKGSQQNLMNEKQSNEVKEEWIMGNKQYSWERNIEYAYNKARNVLVSIYVYVVYIVLLLKWFITCNVALFCIFVAFSKTNIKKKSLRINQKEIQIIDVEVNKIFKCTIHIARRKDASSAYEKYIAQGWYKYVKIKIFSNGDTLVWRIGRFSLYVFVTL